MRIRLNNLKCTQLHEILVSDMFRSKERTFIFSLTVKVSLEGITKNTSTVSNIGLHNL